ncbi:amidohydrolase family protein [Paenirhodobacter populi]|uniref:hypothetical protein n=1 Tax=Paenirhodobacter populi TaxID=2306993 RepID=UPI0019D421D9|nr:hypothetical protein [Sinirhodobacter populi]
MRSHVMVDGSVGLASLETVLAVRAEYRDLIDVELVAFPQSGILRSHGTDRLLDEAISLGADVIGGLDPASFDRDPQRHLDVVFGIAERRGSPFRISARSIGRAVWWPRMAGSSDNRSPSPASTFPGSGRGAGTTDAACRP